MSVSVQLVRQGLTRWASTDEPTRPADVEERCTAGAIEKVIAHLGDVRVTSATINATGRIENPPPSSALPMPPFVEDLPDFCDIRVEKTTPGGHVAQIIVWVPLEWNERFFGTGGGGMRTTLPWFDMETQRTVTMPAVLRNGFATASTDAGIRDPRPSAYALDEKTRELDWELLRNWSYRATHDMTLVGKAVTEAIHGAPPRYSYYSGCSGGGRQGMAEAQRYPDDYDGIWATDPAINWTRFIPAEIWPALVMNQLGNSVSPAKFEAFRALALAAGSGADGLRGRTSEELQACEIDPYQLVGTHTPAGEITERDADVVQKIWEGPRNTDGKFLWYGVRPEAESWGANFMRGGLACVVDRDGELVPEPFSISADWLGAYLLKDPGWDWKTLTFEQFGELFERSVKEFAEFATDDADLSAFRDCGGKLMLTHTTGDEVIFPQGTVDYYRRVEQTMGGREQTADFARLFIGLGAGHGYVSATSAGATIAGSMIALMRWVEEGIAPDEIIAEGYDMATGQVTMSELIPHLGQEPVD